MELRQYASPAPRQITLGQTKTENVFLIVVGVGTLLAVNSSGFNGLTDREIQSTRRCFLRGPLAGSFSLTRTGVIC